jgi:flagellar protein FliS
MVTHDYARAYRANAVLTASPGQLVLMLFDGALRALANARAGFARPAEDGRRFETINSQLLKAQAILSELQGSLNHDAGGEVSRTLAPLYDYFLRRLVEANIRKDEAPVAEVERLLRELRDAWAEMLRQGEAGSGGPVRGVA